MRPQAIDRLGLDYAAVSARSPSIVYCGSFGFRRSGPYGHKPACDDMMQAASGLAALQAVDGVPPSFALQYPGGPAGTGPLGSSEPSASCCSWPASGGQNTLTRCIAVSALSRWRSLGPTL